MCRYASALLVVLSFSPLGATERDPLRPNAVDCVGRFCQTGQVANVCKNRNLVFERADGRRTILFVEDAFDIRGGDIIEAQGELLRHDNGDINPVLRRVRRLGHRPITPPLEVSLAALAASNLIYRAVSVEGTLVRARPDEIDPAYHQLVVRDGHFILNAALHTSDARQEERLADLLGARFRLSGLLMAPTGARKIIAPQLSVDSTDDVKVVAPPPTDLFTAPTLDLNDLSTPAEVSRLGLRRFEGVVLATWGGNQLMVAGADFHHVKATLALERELPPVGSPVAVVGYADADLYGVGLSFARCRTLKGPPTTELAAGPIATTLRNLLTDAKGNRRLNGYSHGRLLRLSGTVLDLQPALLSFSLNEDGFTVPVDCSSSPDALSGLRENSTVEAVVLAVVESDTWQANAVLPQTRGIKLVLRSSDDLKVLAPPPFWTPLRLFFVIIVLVVSIVLIIFVSRLVNRLAMRRKVAERTRLAVELHDSLSQTLAGVTCQVAAGRDAVADDPQTATTLLCAAERMLESSRTELKNCLFDLRNNTVDDPDFARAIAQTLTIFKGETRASVRFNVNRNLLTDSAAHAVLCIIRELVANAVRHGKATRVRVAGAVEERRLAFSVTDNGQGFDPQVHLGPREGHFGLTGIRERLSPLGGTMSIESSDVRTRISITFPL